MTNKKLTYDYIKKSFEKEKYKLISKKYINAHHYLKFICPMGHIHKIMWNNWKSGNRCKICSYTSNISYNNIKESFESEGYILLSKKYINNRQYLKFICSKGHKHKIIWRNWNYGQRCPKCLTSFQTSKGEKEIADYIKNLGIRIKQNDKTMVFNKKTNRFLELDIWMPQIGKAIEYNGDYWHSKKKITNDSLKKKLCKKKNIDLLTIRESLWKSNITKCKSIIKNFCISK